jgi:hypothetical protein
MESILNALKEQGILMLSVIPALIKGVVILIIGVILAKIFYRLILKFLGASSVDNLADKLMSIELFEKSSFDLVPSRIVAGSIYYFIIIVFSMAAVEAMGLKIISDLLKSLIEYIPNGVTAFIILIFGIFIADSIKKLVYSTCQALGVSSGALITNVVFYFVLLNMVLISLRQAKLQTKFMEDNLSIILAGISGAFAIGYGLAARHTISSLLASFYNRDKFHVGDEVTISGKRGEVVTINNSMIILRALDEDSEFVVPYSKVASDGVEIHTRRDKGPALPPHEQGQ